MDAKKRSLGMGGLDNIVSFKDLMIYDLLGAFSVIWKSSRRFVASSSVNQAEQQQLPSKFRVRNLSHVHYNNIKAPRFMMQKD